MGGSSKQTTKTNSTQTYKPDQYAYSAYQSLFPAAQQLAEQAYDPRTSYQVAGFAPQQEQAFSDIGALQGGWAPYMDWASGAIGQGSAPISQEAIQGYMNPYLEDVVGATMANLSETQRQQQQQVLGNSIAQGALGGGMTKAAQAELARQQGLTTGQTLADLRSGAYTQALGAAQQDAIRQLQAAQQMAGLGTETQRLGIEGAQALYTAGSGQQQQLQNLYDVATQNAQQEYMFPYQQLQSLANVYGGIGPLMGGTTTGESTSTGTTKQSTGLGGMLGGALSGLSFLKPSDERVKDNIKPVGKTFDGQTVYSYKYKGDDRTEIGLIAQDVEKKHPEAVESANGTLMVNYDLATRDAARRKHFADGGVVGNPWMQLPSLRREGRFSIPTEQIATAKPIVPQISFQGSEPQRPQEQQDNRSLQQWSQLGTKARAGLDGLLSRIDPSLGWAAQTVPSAAAVAAPNMGGMSNIFSGLGGLFSFADGGAVPVLAGGRYLESVGAGANAAPSSYAPASAAYYSPGRMAMQDVAATSHSPLKFSTPTAGKGSGLFGNLFSKIGGRADGGRVGYADGGVALPLDMLYGQTPEFGLETLRELALSDAISRQGASSAIPQQSVKTQPIVQVQEQPLTLADIGKGDLQPMRPDSYASAQPVERALPAQPQPQQVGFPNITASGGFESGTPDRVKSLANYSRDTGGSRSFGAYGLNTLPGNSAWAFRNEFGRDIGITADPSTSEFKRQWDAVAKENPQALIAAEDAWYQKHVGVPTVRGLRSVGLPDEVANDPRVQAFAADRVDQYGRGLAFGKRHTERWQDAMAASNGDPAALIAAMSQRDKEGLGADFKRYLGENPKHIPGLMNRIDKRTASALGVSGDSVVTQYGTETASGAAGDIQPQSAMDQQPSGGRGAGLIQSMTSDLQKNPSSQQRGGILKSLFGIDFNPLNLDDDERKAMLVAGLSMMSSGDIGKGGLAGMQYLQDRQQSAAQAGRQQREDAMKMANFVAGNRQLVQIGTDATGAPIQGFVDKLTGAVTPIGGGGQQFSQPQVASAGIPQVNMQQAPQAAVQPQSPMAMQTPQPQPIGGTQASGQQVSAPSGFDKIASGEFIGPQWQGKMPEGYIQKQDAATGRFLYTAPGQPALEPREAVSARIKGETAGQKKNEAALDDGYKLQDGISSIDRAYKAADAVLRHPGLESIAGLPFGGSLDIKGVGFDVADIFPGTTQADAFNKYKALLSQGVMQTMNQLKSLSAQGATGFGALSEKEMKVLEDSIGNLRVSSSASELKDNFTAYQQELLKTRERMLSRYENKYGRDSLRGVTVPTRSDLMREANEASIQVSKRPIVTPKRMSLTGTGGAITSLIPMPGINIPFTTTTGKSAEEAQLGSRR